VRRRRSSALARQLAQHPTWFLVGAATAGYLAGGGLAARAVTGRIVRLAGTMAWRFWALPALENKLREAIGLRESDEEGEYA
jgi:hypothetical protein